MICFLGDSHAPRIFRRAAVTKGFQITNDPEAAHIIFISEDVPTTTDGRRDLAPIRKLIELAKGYGATLVLTSQVPPGFTRSLGIEIFHIAETLRIKDALERALHPEMFILGMRDPFDNVPKSLMDYLMAFYCPIMRVRYEDAEFAKIAINMTLAAQVDNTNRLAAAASKCGAEWDVVKAILAYDSRIGRDAYLEPGDWRESKHLLRDWVTFDEISKRGS